MLDDFRRIVESATPQPIQSRLVTPDEAKAVIGSYNRLADPLRTNFLALPIDNIIEFSMLQTKKRPSLYSYMSKEQATPPEPLVEASQGIPETERDQVDQPAQPIVAAPEPVPEPIAEDHPRRTRKPKLVEAKPEEPAAEEQFFTRLLERLEQLAVPPVTDERPFEKLLEVDKGVLLTINRLTEKVEQLAAGADHSRAGLTEMMALHREMLANLNETQAQMSTIQNKLVESQAHIVETISLLADKIALFCQTPPVVNPVVNVPAPIVNVTTQEGRRTKVVERDANNLITRIIEGYEAE